MSDNKLSVAVGGTGVVLANIDEAFRVATAIHRSGMAPAAYKSSEAILVGLLTGMELNFKPMQALNSIDVLHGRASLRGEAALALVQASGRCEYIKDEAMRKGGELVGWRVESKRKDQSEPKVSEFTVEQARKAKLWGRPGPWTDHQERMLYWRALGFNLRTNFGDVLKGLAIVEEQIGRPVEKVEAPKSAVNIDPLASIIDVDPVESIETKTVEAETVEAVDEKKQETPKQEEKQDDTINKIAEMFDAEIIEVVKDKPAENDKKPTEKKAEGIFFFSKAKNKYSFANGADITGLSCPKCKASLPAPAKMPSGRACRCSCGITIFEKPKPKTQETEEPIPF